MRERTGRVSELSRKADAKKIQENHEKISNTMFELVPSRALLCFARDLRNANFEIFLRAKIKIAISHSFLNGLA